MSGGLAGRGSQTDSRIRHRASLCAFKRPHLQVWALEAWQKEGRLGEFAIICRGKVGVRRGGERPLLAGAGALGQAGAGEGGAT